MESAGSALDQLFLDATGQANLNQPGLTTSGLFAGIGIDVSGNLEIGSEQNMINSGCPGATPNTIFQGPYSVGNGTFVGGLICYHGLSVTNNLANGFDYQLYGNKCGTYSSPCTVSSTTTTLYVTPSSGYGSSCTSFPVCGSYLIKVWGGLLNAAASGTIGISVNCPLNGNTPASGVVLIPTGTAFAAAGTHVYGEGGLQCDSGSSISMTVTGAPSIANSWIFDGKVYVN
jgi:hypothetical protein